MAEENTDKRINGQLWLCHNGIEADKVLEKGKVTKYHRTNVSFGVADYYYDYEF